MEHYEELSNDALSIRGYQNLRSNDYHLGGYNSDLFKKKTCVPTGLKITENCRFFYQYLKSQTK